MRTIIKLALLLFWFMFCIGHAAARSAYFDNLDNADPNNSCSDSGCHKSTPDTCNGCHYHGVSNNLLATTDKNVYYVGETITVTLERVGDLPRASGWLRASLYDSDGIAQLDILTDCASPGSGVACGNDTSYASFSHDWPVTLTTPATEAMSSLGQFSLQARWYGYNYNSYAHAEQTIIANSIDVTIPGITVNLADSRDPVIEGEQFSYTITTTNNAGADAVDVVLTDNLPLQVGYVSSNSSQGSCFYSTGSVICDLGALNVGSTASVSITVTAGAAGTMLNTANVTSSVGGSGDINEQTTFKAVATAGGNGVGNEIIRYGGGSLGGDLLMLCIAALLTVPPIRRKF